MFYDYLFYKGYQLAKKSKNWEDTPTLFAVIIIGWCLIMNFGAILFLLEELNRRSLIIESFVSILNEYKYLVGGVVVLLISTYYTYKGRWKKIIIKYENKESKSGKIIHPAIVVIFFYITSFFLGLLSAMFKNGDGIFK